MENLKSLYLFTGKGGVGKTTLALSAANFLKGRGKDVTYFSFAPTPHTNLLNELDIPFYTLDPTKSINEYIKKKFGHLVGEWISDNSFFKALVGIMPGLTYLISIGHIIEIIDNSPNKIAVFDAPASGHAMVMFESLKNFQEIFKSGTLFNDIWHITSRIFSNEFTKSFIVSLPQEMVISETMDLQKEMINSGFKEVDIIFNKLLSLYVSNIPTNHPYITQKIAIEKELLSTVQDKNYIYLPMELGETLKETIENLSPHIGSIF